MTDDCNLEYDGRVRRSKCHLSKVTDNQLFIAIHVTTNYIGTFLIPTDQRFVKVGQVARLLLCNATWELGQYSRYSICVSMFI